ncbi:hypothetical protein KDX38_23165 [Pseudomonas sp. CDFA 602]|uniref:hypothetical protein n=1 Tax=Pseudomonas californiensis TaxID=2829823 RepID=UPI001E417126|nr:hypothetical protein [Pseudomonas californiensis]MCD5996493.1 hypothetical protein [Pseudomonas californiensis]MCD6002092.1 hypothetical protein [Pseudomonas californiensis]
MRNTDQSRLSYLLSSRPLILKQNGLHVCLHDAFSGEILGGQLRVELIQEPDSLAVLRVEFAVDGQMVRLEGK